MGLELGKQKLVAYETDSLTVTSVSFTFGTSKLCKLIFDWGSQDARDV